ncbi:MAG: YlmH/Sll1252 family protein [Tissierellaceae bacterium]|nr:YlmH/Sll1252 family protein [Tissierellaceae bacterium]
MWIDKESYTSHIKDGEKLTKMRRILDKIEIVINKHIVQSTDFLDPYEVYLGKSILNRFDDINYLEFGGYDNSERMIILIFPNYLDIEDPNEYLSCLKVEGDLESLSHKDYLGALLNLGIKREKVGDILVHNDYGYVIAKEEIGDFILYNLEKIGNRNVNIKSISFSEIEIPPKEYKEVKRFLTSFRIDHVISATYNISRKDSMDIIKRGFVKINWESIDKPAREVKEGDIVSVRGYGRFMIHSIEGLSRKGRFMSNIRILI